MNEQVDRKIHGVNPLKGYGYHSINNIYIHLEIWGIRASSIPFHITLDAIIAPKYFDGMIMDNYL